MDHIAVIGGGAAGLLAAVRLLQAGKHITLFERGERLGRKLSATGNITPTIPPFSPAPFGVSARRRRSPFSKRSAASSCPMRAAGCTPQGGRLRQLPTFFAANLPALIPTSASLPKSLPLEGRKTALLFLRRRDATAFPPSFWRRAGAPRPTSARTARRSPS